MNETTQERLRDELRAAISEVKPHPTLAGVIEGGGAVCNALKAYPLGGLNEMGCAIEGYRCRDGEVERLKAIINDMVADKAEWSRACCNVEAENQRLREALEKIGGTIATSSSSSDHARLHAALDSLDDARTLAKAALAGDQGQKVIDTKDPA